MSEIDYAARVAKGVALLDEKRPGWERQIDLETLNIADGSCCVTAQLSGESYWVAGMEQLALTRGDNATYVSHGFNAEDYLPDDDDYDREDVYPVLNSLWRDVVTERLTAAQPD